MPEIALHVAVKIATCNISSNTMSSGALHMVWHMISITFKLRIIAHAWRKYRGKDSFKTQFQILRNHWF